MIITPQNISTKQLHAYLLGSIAPRPICFASTVNAKGERNLSPFSFFNVFGSNPPICVFSPARRVRDNTTKHTLQNIENTQEVVINVVTYNMVQQMSLSSCEYPEGVDEFIKSGFTALPSEDVAPPRVKESPVNLECKVKEIIATGNEGGAGNLIICEIVKIHINENILDENQQIDPHKIDLVARMGQDFYCRASGSAVFEVPKPNLQLGIGVDGLPAAIRTSHVLSGNDLGILGNSTAIPAYDAAFTDEHFITLLKEKSNSSTWVTEVHQYAKELLQKNEIEKAWQVLLHLENN